MEQKTIVVYRTWNKEQETIALFPMEIWSYGLCSSYMHVGQHGGAEYTKVVRDTRPATDEEIALLKRELESIGYVLDERKRYMRGYGS